MSASVALSFCLLLTTLVPLSPAAAQLGGSFTLSSEARLRGRPISEHKPVAAMDLQHDAANGFYMGASAALVAIRSGGIQPLYFTPYAGFARRISSSATLDLGIVHSRYGEYSGISGGRSYTEAYVEVAGRNVSARLFVSPAYFRRNQPTFYAEANGNLDLRHDWLLFGHLGRLIYLRDRPGDSVGASDWRLGLRRQIGRVDVEVAWTGYVEARRFYGVPPRDGSAMVAALSYSF